jgi:hypothetical protein
VTVSGDSDPVDYAWSFLKAAGSQAVQNAVNITDTALTAISNFRNNSNCAAALTIGGAAAGAGIGAYVGGAALGSAGGALAGGSLGGAIGGLAGAVFCNGNAGPGSGGGGGESTGSAQDKKLSPSEIRKLEASTGESAHQIKTEALGTNKSIAQYDLYKDAQGNVFVKGKGGVGEAIPTGLKIN